MYAAASRRSPLPALALTTAAALTLTPLVLPPPTTPMHLSLPQVSAPRLELIAAIKSKRYTHARLSRLCAHILLGVS